MRLSSYISDLLYRYECVIVPDFGGFVTNIKSARLNTHTNTFYPPYKALSFNANLNHNDGLLANYVAKAETCSYNQAIDLIKKEVLLWQQRLKNKQTIELDKIGSLNFNRQLKIVFEPQLNVNYLTTSYGLSPVISSQVIKSVDIPVISLNKKSKNFLKYAAVFVLGLSTIGFGNKLYQNYQLNKQIQVTQTQQKNLQNKIQAATFTITSPLPSITLKNTYVANRFFVVAGAFRESNNAIKMLAKLKIQGFDAAIIGKNKWNLTQVVYGSFVSRYEAINLLSKVRIKSPDAWLLIKKH